MLGKLEKDPGINLQTMSKECKRLINLKRVMCQTEEPEGMKNRGRSNKKYDKKKKK